MPHHPSRILITGASGCIGQAVTAWLLEHSNARLLLWLRQPGKLTAVDRRHPRLELLVGDLRQPWRFRQQLAHVDRVIHTATAWGDPARAWAVNVQAVKELLACLDHQRLQQVLYFSTASILDRHLELLPEAEQWGTEYIQTKAVCLRQLMAHSLRDRIVAVFPTLIFSGRMDGGGLWPTSYLTAGLRPLLQWLWLARFLRLDASYHFIHGADVASICGRLLTTPHRPGPQHWGGMHRYVLGQYPLTVNRTMAQLCRYRHMAYPPGVELRHWLMQALVVVFRIQLSRWDRFTLQRRHFVHHPVTRPESFGLSSRFPDLETVLSGAGVPQRGRLPLG
ncbi:MAG: NAD(P)-dependent oxidoreductase [Synechococcus sp. SB0665_bin_28]|uniref:NAD(P)-dependent oxidoreductase n=1 Tax=Synechococcus sp. SB0676_bin_10 TaxID=2604869 RepID=A0A6B1F6D4_9SYNE|nr:NAD(P)-dependent oxidoreductase [Synechococcus sp. SB0664_bin_36]MXY62894.1 NAD(P)-dependent oxidoreductase [Synechococcus sp. SB0665_bin_28]MYF19345.1 NAD(P)-dependent oxidoreductase [Synechococcus sp. SB0677_bin_5]MYF36117.1 NAD(P)-dependent oxidoreductase [Synechococcus sp. SB0678_bin_12]MYG38541.1 NAD(P)-dependent oxidoreductase [Synechococcus sp. SB0676_bin_10]MYG64331.1 NAD(P)-dependent oxidoreductase [Synechococcus sp. SB0675_bin_7]MYI87719.1 NAD(P)-dependent oxidoreductase [Synecho